PQKRLQDRVIAALIFPTENDVNVPRERLQCLDRRIHVCRLGVVVELDAVDRRHVLQPVLDGLEILHRGANFLCRHADDHPDPYPPPPPPPERSRLCVRPSPAHPLAASPPPPPPHPNRRSVPPARPPPPQPLSCG